MVVDAVLFRVSSHVHLNFSIAMAHVDPCVDMRGWSLACEHTISEAYKKLEKRRQVAQAELTAVEPEMARLEMCLTHLRQIRAELGEHSASPAETPPSNNRASAGGKERR